MIDDGVKKFLLDHRAEHLAVLGEFLAIESVSNRPTAEGCGPCATWLAEYLRGLGFAVDIWPTAGQPCVFAELIKDETAPTVLIYGHYDVQPAEPLDQWKTDPFKLIEREGWLYGRGINDDKGPFFAYIMAIEAFLKTRGTLPVNVKILGEGEEEIGSPSMEALLCERADTLRADTLVLSDSGFFEDKHPAITYGLRGMCYYEITVTGPARDLHSGQAGGMVANPINALARLIGMMHDESGRITIPGFYDDVIEATDQERAEWAALPFDDEATAENLGVKELAGGERDLSAIERCWARPTLDCNGIVGGYTQSGAKTIIPARASAKISMRLVPDQAPDKITAGLRKFIEDNAPAGVSVAVQVLSQGRAVLIDRNSPAVLAGQRAMAEAFDVEPLWIRCGGSIGVIEMFQRILNLDSVNLGLGGENIHSPNERMKSECLWNGSLMAAAFLENFASCPRNNFV